ncbi:ricin-type beta-trefoil lectin domain protein [Streptomyces sp. NPDC055815]
MYAGATTYDTQTEYDAFGRVIRSTVNPWGGEVVATSLYDQATGRVRATYLDKQTSTTGAVEQVEYTYNPAGRITSVTDVPDNNPAARDRQCFTYDHLGRMTTAWTDTGGITTPAPEQHRTLDQGSCTHTDPIGGAIAPSTNTVGGPSPYWHDYQYDPTGNRTAKVVHDPSGDTTKDITTTQGFGTPGTGNTPTSAAGTGGGTGGPHALLTTGVKTGATASDSGTTEYDASGHPTALGTNKTGTATLTWNGEDRLNSYAPAVAVTGIGGKCLDIQGGRSTDGTQVQIYTCNTGGGQKYATAGDRLKTLGKCVTAMGTAAGSPVQLQPCDGRAGQTWQPRADGTLYNPAATRCLAVPGEVTTNSTPLQLADCVPTPPAGQKWTVPDKTSTYVYDADGNQLVRRSPGKTVVNLGTDQVVYDSAAKTLTGVRSYPVPGGLTIVRTGAGTAAGGFVAQLADHHGTHTVSVDLSSGQTVVRRPSDPFGNPRGTQPAVGAWAGDKGFVGGTQDTATGLTNLGARQYQPATGRFLTPDPLLTPDDPQQWNGYAYGANDPVNKADPTGLNWFDPGKLFGRLVTGIVELVTKADVFKEKYIPAHDFTIEMHAVWLMVNQPKGGGTVTMDTANLGKGINPGNQIPGASKGNPGNLKINGKADLIYWTADTVYVWEVKNAGGPAEKAGGEEVKNYVKYLQMKLESQGDTRKVEVGFDTSFLAGANPYQPGNWVASKPSSEFEGVIVYRNETKGRERPKAEPRTVPEYNRVPAPSPQTAPTTEKMPKGTTFSPSELRPNEPSPAPAEHTHGWTFEMPTINWGNVVKQTGEGIVVGLIIIGGIATAPIQS